MPPRLRTAPRKRPTQARATATVEAILLATSRLLAREGYDRLSTNRVAEEAGVSVGSLYQYFPSKEALVATLAERHRERTMALVLGTII
jgi:AcrR family transcriptional regulator